MHFERVLPLSEVKVKLFLSLDCIFLSPGPALEYSGTVWVFAPLSGLLLLHADGSIYSIHNHLALSLFGYNKDELLRKVSQHDQLNKAVWINDSANSHFCHCCCVINRVSLFWCPVSMDGCLTRTERPALSLILKQRLVNVQPHPKYQGNLVSIFLYLWWVQLGSFFFIYHSGSYHASATALLFYVHFVFSFSSICLLCVWFNHVPSFSQS